jgi:hypothetical protein
MSGVFGGSTKSGTPRETQGLASNLARQLQSYTTGQPMLTDKAGQTTYAENPYGRYTSAAIGNIMGPGFDPSILGSTATDVLQNPADATKGLFASLAPFEQRAADEAAAGVREGMGTLGTRFSRNTMDAEGRARGEVANQFEKTRQEGLLKANDQRIAALAQMFQTMLGGEQIGTQQLGQILGFANPGAPIVQQGIGPGLLSTGATLLLGKILGFGGGGGNKTVSTGAQQTDNWNLFSPATGG